MADLSERLGAEKDAVGRFLLDLDDVLSRGEYSFVEAAAVSTLLQRICCGMENILSIALEQSGANPQRGVFWRRDLLNAAVSRGIIKEWLSVELFEYMAFRQFFAHGRGYVPEDSSVKYLAVNMSNIWSDYSKQVEEYVKTTKK